MCKDMSLRRMYNVLFEDGKKAPMLYEDVCRALGFSAVSGFVEISNRGTITFTCGKPHEIKALLSAAARCGMVPAKKLRDIAL